MLMQNIQRLTIMASGKNHCQIQRKNLLGSKQRPITTITEMFDEKIFLLSKQACDILGFFLI